MENTSGFRESHQSIIVIIIIEVDIHIDIVQLNSQNKSLADDFNEYFSKHVLGLQQVWPQFQLYFSKLPCLPINCQW